MVPKGGLDRSASCDVALAPSAGRGADACLSSDMCITLVGEEAPQGAIPVREWGHHKVALFLPIRSALEAGSSLRRAPFETKRRPTFR